MHIQSVGIAGYGQFGQFIHALCKKFLPDVEVRIASSSYQGALPLEKVCTADIVFPCAPIACFEEQMEEIRSLLGEHTILREVCTVKVHPSRILQKIPGLRYICSHPMFGPESFKKQGESVSGLTMAWCGDSLEKEIRDSLWAVLKKVGIHLVSMTPDEHDEQLAGTLFLTHYVSQIIYQSSFDRSDIDTVSFGFLMDAVESVKDNEALFKDVWKYNPYCKTIVETFATTNVKILTSLPETVVEHEIG